MPKGVRRNPFQALLVTAEKQLQSARERLSTAEKHADCIHQKNIRVARVEHDEWVKMVKQLKTSLTIPQLRPPAVEIPTAMLEDTPPLPPIPEPASKKQSNNDAHGPAGQPDAGDRMSRRGPQLTGKTGRPGRVNHFDKCPGLVGLNCRNSKPFDSALCARCEAIKGVRVTA